MTALSGVLDPVCGYRLAEPDVIHQLFGEEIVAIDLRSGGYFSLSPVAGQVWLLLAGEGARVDAVVQALARRYNLAADRLLGDLQPFLSQLLDLELIVPCAASPPSAADADIPETNTPYAPPSLSTYNDLAELLLLDPVHEVDAAAGWPHPAPGLPEPTHAARTADTDADLLEACLDGTSLVVNRDLGCYVVLDGGGTALWEQLKAGPVEVSDHDLRGSLEAAGLVQPATTSTAASPMPSGSPIGIRVHHELEAIMRPWIRAPRPQPREQTAQGRQLIERLDRCFEETAAAEGIERRGFRIGGALVRVLSIPGQNAQPVQDALSHLALVLPPAVSVDLEIRLWTLATPPSAPLLADLFQRLRENWEQVCGPRGEVLELQGTNVSAIYNAGPDVLSVVDVKAGRAWFVKLDALPMPYWELGSPFRFLLHSWSARRGLQFVHAAAVGDARGAVLLVGPGGAGKSTTSMLCAAAGMHFAGDDYCLVDAAAGWVYSLYCSGKLVGEDDLERFPSLRGRARNPDGFEGGGDGKAVVMLNEVWPDRMVERMPIRLLAIPRITGRLETRVEPASAVDALLALLPSTVGQLPEANGSDCERLLNLVSSCPAVTLALGSDPDGIHRAVSGLLG
ncbi:PqqD family protein [Synechococcus sp. CBW1004]|uniref:PqqD family protein n=1 Tax=Synechococcus sp. CBW1004 TaxID=1353136 RepID=UPI0018CCDB14|nr:PqqD family protein [Synechococcus sp. CBW1004]QPN62988.1 PqqD family protein [Synechococcus sp. CBW1004]